MKIGATVIQLGKVVYVVFFAMAALWLCLTAESE